MVSGQGLLVFPKTTFQTPDSYQKLIGEYEILMLQILVYQSSSIKESFNNFKLY